MYLWLKQSALEKNQSLPLELMDKLAERYAEIVILLPLLILKQLRQTFCEPLQNLNVREISVHMSAVPLMIDYTLPPAPLSGFLRDHNDGRLSRRTHVPLRKPQLCDNPQLCLDRAKMLRTVADHHNGLLNRASGNLCRPVDQLARVELSCTRYAEERRGGVGRSMRATEGKVRVVFCGGMRAVGQSHEGQ
jgi:hypothetical protein